jgi:DNA-binding Xre family transcriptional regulator
LADAGSLSLAEAKASSLKDLAEQKGMSPAKVRDLLIEKIK